EEIFTQEELIEIFDPERLSTSAAIFDQPKLKWMNNEYIKAADTERIIELAMPHLIEAGKLPENMDASTREWAEKVIALYQEQLRYGAEIVKLTELFLMSSSVTMKRPWMCCSRSKSLKCFRSSRISGFTWRISRELPLNNRLRQHKKKPDTAANSYSCQSAWQRPVRHTGQSCRQPLNYWAGKLL